MALKPNQFNKVYFFNLENIVVNFPGYIYWLDKNNIYQGCNTLYAKALGLESTSDIVGKNFTDIKLYQDPSAFIETANKINNQVITTATSKKVEEKLLKKDGNLVNFLSNKLPLKDKTGNVIGILNISTDITEHKKKVSELKTKMEQAELALDSIVANMPGHVYWKDKNGVYLGCNNRQAISLGLKYGNELIGKTDFDLPWGEDSAKIFRENDLRIMAKGTTETVEEPTNIGGKERIMLSQKAPLKNKDNRITGVLGISIDITKLKETEKKLIVAKETAEIANRLKTDFIHNMEHDIRTPFCGVWGLADDLWKNETNPEKKEILGYITQSAKELLDYCNNILDLSKIEAGKTPVLAKKFDLKELINKIISIENPASILKKLNLSYEISDEVPPILKGDPERLERILINLVSNAIKFTSAGYVKIKIDVAKKSRGKIILHFYIEDTGIGIPPDKQAFIYEKFTRGTPSNQGIYKGTGLGLYVVKQLIEEINGEIDVISEINKGTRFICTIPFKLPLVEEVF